MAAQTRQFETWALLVTAKAARSASAEKEDYPQVGRYRSGGPKEGRHDTIFENALLQGHTDHKISGSQSLADCTSCLISVVYLLYFR